MKKIEIITRHAIANYGSILQAIATQTFFNELGSEARIIDYVSKNETVFNGTKTFSNRCKNKLKRLVYVLVKLPDEFIKNAKFKKFRKKTLNLTPKFDSIEALQNYDFSDSYLCAGSDQLWGYMPNGKIDPAYFLDFGTSKNTFFSYSASLGRTDFNEEYYKNLNEYLAKFSFITVREQSGVSLIEGKTPYQAKHVLDPTLMLERDFWLDYADKKIKEKPYILLYQLRRNSFIDQYAKAVAKKYNLKIVRVSTSIYDIFRFGKKKILKDPKTVLSLFKNAECVISDSFHATVFSLIFNKKFVDVLPKTTHERITDLLRLVGLQSRVVNELTEQSLNEIEGDIDYNAVNERLNAYRTESREIFARELGKLSKE